MNISEQIYSCPMHPNVQQDKPGMCPECGMNLLPVKRKKAAPMDHSMSGHDMHEMKEGLNKHEGHNVNMFAKKFWVSLFLTLPVVLYSDLPHDLIKWSAPVFPGSQYLGFVLGSFVFFMEDGCFW